MYRPAHFSWDDPASQLAFCRAHPFATVVATGEHGPEAQHLPLLVDREDGRLLLRGHAAVGNPLWRATRAMAIFHGPHAYVSAAWYEEPDTVPTWNYLAIHARSLSEIGARGWRRYRTADPRRQSGRIARAI